MKVLQSLMHRLEKAHLLDNLRPLSKYSSVFHQAVRSYQNASNTTESRKLQPSIIDLEADYQVIPAIRSPRAKQSLLKKAGRSPLVLGIAIVSLTSAFGYRFYNAPKLDIGKAAPQTLYAPVSANVMDKSATDISRIAARKDTLSVLMLDQAVNQTVMRSLQQQLQQGSDLRQTAGSFPYVRTSILTLFTQAYLRKLPESQWQALLIEADRGFSRNPSVPSLKAGIPAFSPTDAGSRTAIAELRNYRRSIDMSSYLRLVQSVSEAQLKYVAALASSTEPSPDLPDSLNTVLLDLTDADWQSLRSQSPKIAERILAQGISPALPSPVLATAINLQVKGELPNTAEPIAIDLLTSLLQPNLIQDEAQTQLRAEQAAQDIQPVMVSINRGEKIVQVGDTIDSKEFALLDHFGLSKRGIDWFGLVGFGALVSGSVILVWFVKRRFHPSLRRRDGVLLGLLSLSTPLLIALQVPSINLATIGLLVGGFYGAPLGLTVAGLLALLVSVGMEITWSTLIASATTGLLCGWLGGRLRSREELALLGVGVGLLQGLIYLVLNVATGVAWYTLLSASGIQALLGLAWVIVALGISPYLEQLFDLVTTIRLVELANPNRPLLKRLASEAPGTFQHTLFVATLAEAAARALGGNVELVRTGTLYHDIGKMHDPQGFIENQMGGPNKHDLIDDPWISAEIIKKHVSEGIMMARKARLPKAVRAFIPEHQGTMLIAYFHHQAQQQVEQQLNGGGTTLSVNDGDFRYDGPIPQSRETGIVMLADSCEAALRSLKDATPEEALAMINKILRARWQDEQLVQSGLTRSEMTEIATVFVQVWQQFNHQRIAYPKLAIAAQPSP
ncbi:HDIG domain-containing protein [Phormidium sp. CLA17]|uniref:HD family phosphohydrolase n=1 Tax=Leptolyngbya sp. Cla-17 TaxID=2803751 RepID=UPI001491F5DD|nr:HDIG domain-containing metalloprotein [Leptolyngbya sp. Cla-17]MBM0740738.1 HDIG domain-containing protein [Leptolyngbya sp. Cla-17]